MRRTGGGVLGIVAWRIPNLGGRDFKGKNHVHHRNTGMLVFIRNDQDLAK